MATDRAELAQRAYRKLRTQVLSASDICILCGHAGSDAVDHVVPVKRGGERMALGNLAPIHGVDGCPVCLMKCNNIKGDKLLSEVRRLVTSRDWYAGPV